MRTFGLIAGGVAIGVVAEILALGWVYAGTNLFHGGHPNGVANILLPGIGIVDHLSNHVPALVPLALFAVSLVQLPVYGVLGAIDWANRATSRVTKAALILHLAASSLAFYGVFLEKRWRTELAQHGACIRANPRADDLSRSSSEIVFSVRWTEQSRKEIARLRSEKANGAIFAPDPEVGLLRNLESQEQALERQWDAYKRLGGPARSPAEVAVIASPCGKEPRQPYIF